MVELVGAAVGPGAEDGGTFGAVLEEGGDECGPDALSLDGGRDGDFDDFVSMAEPFGCFSGAEPAGYGVVPPLAIGASVAVGHAAHGAVEFCDEEAEARAVAMGVADAGTDFAAAVEVAVGWLGEGVAVDRDGPLEEGAMGVDLADSEGGGGHASRGIGFFRRRGLC